jgi:hypothetical protein
VIKEYAIIGARAELARIGEPRVVVDVERKGNSDAVIILEDGKRITVGGRMAVKLRKMLRARYQAPWTPRSRGDD